MKRKKILLLLMAAALTMAACGNAETANNSKTEPTEKATLVAEQTESNNSGEVNISIETLENSQVVSYYVGMHNESVISLYYKTDSYCIGGMHGNIKWSTINYDTATGTILTLADMFEDRDTAAESIKENILNQCIAQNIQGYGENERLQAINEIVEGENWYLAEEGIHFWANEYTLGGVEEIYEFVIRYDELTGWKE